MRRAGGLKALGVIVAVLAAAAMPASAVELKIPTLAPDNSHWMREMRAGAKLISERTDDRVRIKFYPGGVMGSDQQVLRKIRAGQYQGGAFTAGGLGERYPALNVYSIPLLFNSLEEVDYVRERIDPLLKAGLEDVGFVSFGFVEGGFANMLANFPIRTVEDMRRMKVWVPDGDVFSFMAMEELGLSPVPLPVTDVLTALQTHALDVVAASPSVVLVLQWHTKVNYISDLPVSYSMGVFAIESRAFDRLDAADQQVVREVMGDVMTELDRAARKDNEESRRALADIGVKTVAVDNANLEDWRATVSSLYPRLRGRDDFDMAMFERVLKLLDEYRAAHAGSSR
jgi:TRAP-type C4-dicarboxylate transport system substrate-binding protein